MADEPTPDLDPAGARQLSAVTVTLRIIAVVLVPALALIIVKLFLE